MEHSSDGHSEQEQEAGRQRTLQGQKLHALERVRKMSERKWIKVWTHFNVTDSTKAECRLKVKILYRAGSTNNLHRLMRTVHPSERRNRINIDFSECQSSLKTCHNCYLDAAFSF